MSSEKVLRWIGICLFLCLVFSPLLALFIEMFKAMAAGHWDWLSLAIPSERRLMLLLRTVGLALSVSIAGMIIGAGVAVALWRWNKGFAGYLPWIALILAPIPPYIHALAWSTFLNLINSIAVQFGLPSISMQGEVFAWWVQLMTLLPIGIGLSIAALKIVHPSLIEAGRILRTDIRSLFNIILPLASPLLLAGCGLLFILSIMDYSIPYLFQVNVYSMEIFVEYSASNEPVRAFMVSIPLLIIAATVIFFSQSAIKNVTQSASWHARIWKTPPIWPAWFRFFLAIIIVITAVQVLVPLANLSIAASSVPDPGSTVMSAGSEITYSLWLSLLSALLSILLAAAVAPLLLKPGRSSPWWWVSITCALAIPPALSGIGLVAVWNNPVMPPLYGTALMPLLASLARFTPLAVIVLAAQLRRIDPLLLDAAKMLQARPLQALWKIWVPLAAPGILAAAGIVFALTAGELAATLIVAAPGQATLTMRIYNLLHYGATNSIAVLCLIIFLVTLLAGLLAAWAFSRRNRTVPGAI